MFKAAELNQQKFPCWKAPNFANPANMATIHKLLGLGGTCKVKKLFCYYCSLTSNLCATPNIGYNICIKYQTKHTICPTWECYHQDMPDEAYKEKK